MVDLGRVIKGKGVHFITNILNTPLPRPMIKYIAKHHPFHSLLGAEIGVDLGLNAESILRTLDMETLFLVDPYIAYHGYFSENICGLKRNFELAKKRLHNYNGKTVWLLKKSIDALNYLPNNLDFVYLDGEHSYKTVKAEIEGFYPKLRRGSILGGHNFSVRWPGVVKAIIEFTETNIDKKFSVNDDWWIIKE